MQGLYLLLAAFSIPHLIDDFLFDIPADFGISERTAQILAGVFIVIYLAIFRELVLEKRSGVLGGMGMGAFLALAGLLKHVPLMFRPGPYWSGWFSEILIIGMICSGLLLAGFGLVVLKGNQ